MILLAYDNDKYDTYLMVESNSN